MNSTEKRKFTLLAILSLVAFGIAAYLTQHFYEVRGGVAGFSSFCNLGASMNCDVVSASRYAELLPGVPLSSAAGGWYLALFIIALFGRNLFWHREAKRASFVMTAVALALSVFYVALMAFVIKTYCLFCLVAHAIDLVMFLIVLSLKPEGLGEHKPDLAKWKIFGGVTAGSLVAVTLLFLTFDPVTLNRARINSLADTVMATSALSINNRAELTSFGNSTAPIVVTEFLDFQCPSCRLGAQSMSSLVTLFPDDVRVVMRNYPLDPSCNPNMTSAGHPAACEAARANQCAARQGQLKAAYQDIFENQESLAPGVPTARIKALAGIDGAAFDTCMASPEIAAVIAEDIREGTTLGVRSTPTFFFNGRKVEGVYPLQVWSELVKRTRAQLTQTK